LVLWLFEALCASDTPRVNLNRAVFFTELFRETEGQQLVLRWAKALKDPAHE
jgi:formate C-acetyltransferase